MKACLEVCRHALLFAKSRWALLTWHVGQGRDKRTFDFVLEVVVDVGTDLSDLPLITHSINPRIP